MLFILPIGTSILIVCLLSFVGFNLINYLFPDRFSERRDE